MPVSRRAGEYVHRSASPLLSSDIDGGISMAVNESDTTDMADEKTATIEKLQSFDLGEAGGGEQLIIDYRAASTTEYYVMALGNAPRINNESETGGGIKYAFLS